MIPYGDLINQLIDVSYDTGYYSGKREDGREHHLSAKVRRGHKKEELLGVCNGMVEALEQAEQTIRNLGNGALSGEWRQIALNEAENIRAALILAGVTP